MVADKVAPKDHASQCQRCAQAGVKNGDKEIRRQMQHADRDAACHHDGHDDKRFYIEEFDKPLPFFVSNNSFCVLFYQPAKNEELENGKYYGRQEDVERC